VTGLVAASCNVPANGSYTAPCTIPGGLHIPISYFSIAPILIVSGGSLLLLALAAVLPKRSRPGLWAGVTVVIGGAAAVVSGFNWSNISTHGARATISQQVFYDHFTVLFELLIASSIILGALTADSYLQREGLDGPEAYALMLLCGAGGMLMADSGGLVMLFLGLEILSISLYVMAAYHRRRLESGEAGLKYFILGSFSSAIFLYGAALLYGATGSTQFGEINRFLATNVLSNNGVLLAGMGLLIVGLGFKVAAVPFHFWTPDVYQGSPTPFTGYMAAVAKAAGFAGLFRVLMEALPTEQVNWRPIIWLIAVLTLVVGSVLAIVQKDLKRMLGYSSISQAGYVLIGLQAASQQGTSAALFYLFTYTFIIIGSFSVVGVIQGRGEARNDLGAIRGLGRRQPLLAGTMLLFLLAQAGVPFTSGFLAKFYVIDAIVGRGQYELGIIGMLAAAIAAFFYLRVALLMYSSPTPEAGDAADPVLYTGLEPDSGSMVFRRRPPSNGAHFPGRVARGTTGGYGGQLPTDSEPEREVARPGVGPGAALAAGAGVPREGDAAGAGGAGAGAGGAGAGGADGGPLLPPVGRIEVPVTDTIVLAICAAFTIMAGVSSPIIDFAKHATMLF
jgi:NADH-quinone oxidoreductase subunit N